MGGTKNYGSRFGMSASSGGSRNWSLVILFFCFLYIGSAIITRPAMAVTDVLQDFSASDSLTANFNDGDATPIFSWGGTAGLGGGGGINVPNNTTEIWTTKQGYTLAANGIYTVSAYFKVVQNSGYGGLGFVVSSSNVKGSTTAGPNNSNLGMAFHGGGGSFINNNTETNVSWPPDLVLGNWYKMIYKVTATGGGGYAIQKGRRHHGV